MTCPVSLSPTVGLYQKEIQSTLPCPSNSYELLTAKAFQRCLLHCAPFMPCHSKMSLRTASLSIAAPKAPWAEPAPLT